MVQPVPAPPYNIPIINNKILEGNNQKLILLRRGNALSGAPILIGNYQLPKPPINIGITTKNILIIPCAVIITLY
jgi:hypothetical protein